GEERDQAAGALARRGEDATPRTAPARPHHRHAPHAALQHESGRGADRPEISWAAYAPAADRRAARYLRIDEPVHTAVPAFPPRGHRRAQARLLVPVRYATDQRDACA